MSANHELVPDDDVPPLIGCTETANGWRFTVRDFHQRIIGSLHFQTREDAQQAEQVFRETVARAPEGKVREVMRDFFDRQAETIPEWWSIGAEEDTTEREAQ